MSNNQGYLHCSPDHPEDDFGTWQHFSPPNPHNTENFPHSSNGMCPVCGAEIVEIGEFADFDENLELTEEYTQVCTYCLWQSEPYYDE